MLLRSIFFKFIFLFFYFEPIFAQISNQKIFCISIPKCGTHLLSKCISLLTNKIERISPVNQISNFNHKKEFLICHASWSPNFEKKLKQGNFKTFFIYRDPRDQIVSLTFFILKIGKKVVINNKEYLKFEGLLFPTTFDSILRFNLKRVEKLYQNYIIWNEKPFVCSLKFEDLVGPQGGGNLFLQFESIRTICKHLAINKQNKLYIKNAINNIFGGTWTFRQGKIGSWKKYFTQEHKELFKLKAGKLLIHLGYEKNLDW